MGFYRRSAFLKCAHVNGKHFTFNQIFTEIAWKLLLQEGFGEKQRVCFTSKVNFCLLWSSQGALFFLIFVNIYFLELKKACLHQHTLYSLGNYTNWKKSFLVHSAMNLCCPVIHCKQWKQILSHLKSFQHSSNVFP